MLWVDRQKERERVKPNQNSTSLWDGAFASLFGGLFALLTLFVCVFELDPAQHPYPKWPFSADGRIGYWELQQVWAYACALGAFGIFFWGILRRWSWTTQKGVQRSIKFAVASVVFLTGFAYFYLENGISKDHFAHRYDTYHYFLHPRYYDEMDYADLYACTVEALPQSLIPDDARVRDLRDYSMTTAGRLREQELCISWEKFTPEAWARWTEDLRLFTATQGGLDRVLTGIRDRGFNGTPFHATLSGYLADKVPFTIATHNLLPLMDAAMICLMLYFATVVFGWKIGLIFALSVFAMAVDRWDIIGGSWFRYAWYVSLAFGVIALRRGCYAWSGGWFAISTLLNVFPVLFAFGVVVRGISVCWRERKLLPNYRNFVLAGIATGVLGLGVGLLPERHMGNYTGWFANMQNHNVERFQGFGVGLKFSFIYRGANTLDKDRVPESERRALFHENRVAYYPLMIALVGLSMAFAARTDSDVEASVVVGFTLFFCLLGTVGYYFACASLLVLGLYRRVNSPGGLIFLALWFVTNSVAIFAAIETHYWRFMFNTVISLSWTIWLTALLFWLSAKEGVLDWLARLIAAPAPNAE